MSSLDIALALLLAQGLLGAFDVFYNHEWDAKLPRQPSARQELAIHCVRGVLYGVLFVGVAWFEWHGTWTLALAALVTVEVWLTLWDFVVEDRSRRLSAVERVTHTILAMNGGAYIGFLAHHAVAEWWSQPSALVLGAPDWRTWILTCYAVGVTASGIRDGLASHALAGKDSTPVRNSIGASAV